jgi:hypothetical protein
MLRLRRVFLFALAGLLGLVLHGTSDAAGFNDPTGRVPGACHSETAKEIVLLTFGQSISANLGEAAYKPRGNAINFNPNDGHCYVATDPLLGADVGNDSHVGSICATNSSPVSDGTVASLLQSPKVTPAWRIGRREAGLITSGSRKCRGVARQRPFAISNTLRPRGI